jgi:hypothetical protein
MIRCLMLLALFVLAVRPAQAEVSAEGPVCRLPAVIDVMTQSLRLNPYYAHIDPWLVSEAPTSDPHVMRCYVCLNIILYDTTRLGEVPAARCEVRIFSVRLLRNGFVVDLAR